VHDHQDVHVTVVVPGVGDAVGTVVVEEPPIDAPVVQGLEDLDDELPGPRLVVREAVD
jgi:hypothetical protein